MKIFTTLWIVLLLSASHVIGKLEIKNDAIQRFELNGKLKQRRQVQVECNAKGTQQEKDEWTKFTVTEAQSSGPPKIRKVWMRCHPPEKEYVEFENEYVPLWTAQWQQKSCLTPYSKENLTDVREIYSGPPGPSGGRRLLSLNEWQHENDTDNPYEHQLLGSFETLSRHQRKLLGLSPKLLVGTGGIGIGFDLTCILPSAISSFLGGCQNGGPDQALTEINKQLKLFTEFMTNQQAFNADVRSFMSEQILVNKQLQIQIDRNTDSIASLNKMVPLIWEFQMALSKHMTEGFEQQKHAILGVAQATEGLANTMEFMFNATNNQFLTLTRTTQGINQQVNDLLVTVYQIYVNLGMKRAVTADFYAGYEIPIVPPSIFNNRLWPNEDQISYPFLTIQNSNKPRPQGVNGKNNLRDSLIVARTTLQFTTSDRIAWSYDLLYRCDLDFLLNNAVPNVELKTLMGRIGPPGCYRGDAATPWTCQCVVQVVPNSCVGQLPANTLFPWSYRDTTVLNQQGGQTVCPGGTNQPTHVILTRQTDLVAYLDANFCRRPSVSFLNAPGPGSWAYRMIVGEAKMTNISNSNGLGAGCTDVFDASPGSNGLANSLYLNWQMSYKAVFQTTLQTREREIYGVTPGPEDGLSQISLPWSYDPTFGNTQACILSSFTQVSHIKQKVYSEEFLQQFSGIEVRVYDDNNIPTEYRVPDGVGAYGDWLAIPGESLSTLVQTNIEGGDVLPSSFHRIGSLFGEQIGSNPNAPPVVFSFPISQVSDAQSSAGRCGSLNYVAQRIRDGNANVPINLAEWKTLFQDLFDPACAKAQLFAYMRGIKTVNGHPECDSMPTDSGNWKPISKEMFLWCLILKYFAVRVINVGNERHLAFIPYTYTVSGWVTFPAGEYSTSISSLCPVANVQPVGGRALVTLTSPTPFPNQIYYSVTTQGCHDVPTPKRPCSRCDVSKTPLTLEPNVASTIDVKECIGAPLRFNVYTVENFDVPCYGVAGLDVSSTANRSSSLVDEITVEDLVRRSTSQSRDSILDALARLSNINIEYKQKLDQVAAMSFSSRAELEKRVYPIVREQIEQINRIVVPNMTERANEINRQVQEETRKIADNIIANNQSSFDVWRAIARQEYLYNSTGVIFLTLNNTLYRIHLQQAVIDKVLQEYLDRNKYDQKCSDTFGKIPILGQLACGITDMFSGAFDWLSKFFKSPMDWLWWIVGIICFLCILACCVFCCIQCGGPCIAACRDSADCTQGCRRTFNSVSGNYALPAMPFNAGAAPDVAAFLAAIQQAGVQADPARVAEFVTMLKAQQAAKLAVPVPTHGLYGEHFYKTV